jgi:hypothetical protein
MNLKEENPIRRIPPRNQKRHPRNQKRHPRNQKRHPRNQKRHPRKLPIGFLFYDSKSSN